MMLISVIGAGDASAEGVERAEAVGRLLAERGHTVVCGGLGGIMAAVCRGASAAGGHTIGLLPGDHASAANADVEFALPTGLGVARNALVVRAGAAVIAVEGSYGTLSEIAYALQFGKPVVGLGTWPLTDSEGRDPIVRAATAEEAVERALALAAAAGPRSSCLS